MSFVDGESFSVPLTKEKIQQHNSASYNSRMRRNITQGVQGLGVWYQTTRTDNSLTNRNETHIGLLSLVARSGETVLQAQKGFYEIAKIVGLPVHMPGISSTPVNWYEHAFLMGSGFAAAGDSTPKGKLKATKTLCRILEENTKCGIVKFKQSCAPGHGKGPGNDGEQMLTGTDSLRLRYQSSLPYTLEDRKVRRRCHDSARLN